MSRSNHFTRKDRAVREAYYSREAIAEALREVRKLCNQKQVVEMLEGML